MLIFERNSATLDVKNQLESLSDISIQVRKKSKNKYLNSLIDLQTTQKTLARRFQLEGS